MRPAKPVICGEVAYEGHTDRPKNKLFFNHDETPPFPQRFLFWTAMLQGAAGHTYGANGIWQVESPQHPHGWSGIFTKNNFWETPWYKAKDFVGSNTLPIGRKLLERYDWWRFEPHQDWVKPAGTSLTRPHDKWAPPVRQWNRIKGNAMLPYAAGIPREVRIVYLPHGAPAPQIVKIEPGAAYHAFYFSPLDGKEHDLGKVEPDAGAWQAPDVPSKDLDWVLVLENGK